ncbi:MAG: SCP2 sterol-binding domain-containing protein [Acidimicrobiales bacterium]
MTEGLSLTVEHEVAQPSGEVVRYHVAIDRGTVRVRPGPAGEATVRFSQDAATAWEVASGRGSAQRAFMTGRLRVGGDLRVLLDHAEVLGQLHDAFAEVRSATVEA